MDALIKVGAAVAVAAVVAVAVTSIGPRAAPVPPAYTTPAYSQALNAKIAAYAAAVGPTAPKATADVGGITLRSVGFGFPTAGRDFPPGPGADTMAGNCMSCHTPGMILNQPTLTQAEWTGEVTKMVKVYKAPIADTDIPAIVTYLASLKVAP